MGLEELRGISSVEVGKALELLEVCGSRGYSTDILGQDMVVGCGV